MKKKLFLFLLLVLALSVAYLMLHSPNQIKQGYRGAFLGAHPDDIPDLVLSWEDEEDPNFPRFYERKRDNGRTADGYQYIQYIFFDNRLYFISMDLEVLPATDTVYTWLHKTYGAPTESSNALNTHQLQVWKQGRYELRVLQERLHEGNILKYKLEYHDTHTEEDVHAYERKKRKE